MTETSATDGTVDLTFEVAIRAGLDEVWELLSTSEGRAAWFGTDGDIDLVVGGASVVAWGDEQSIEATVDAVEPLQRLRLVYLEDGVEAGVEEYWLDHDDGTTRVRLLQSLPAMEEGWDGFFGDLERGWRLFLASLRYAAEDAPVAHRTAVARVVPATSRPAAWAAALDCLGLDEAPAVGDRVEVPFTGSMDVALVDPPNALLLTGADRTILHDVEGGGEHLVTFLQAATHGAEDPAAAEWRGGILDHFATALAG